MIVVYIGEKSLFHRAGMAATQSSETLVLSAVLLCQSSHNYFCLMV